MDAATEEDEPHIAEAEDEVPIVAVGVARNRDTPAIIRDELLVGRAMEIMDMILASFDNPNPCLLHALATILENEEARFVLFCSLLNSLCVYI